MAQMITIMGRAVQIPAWLVPDGKGTLVILRQAMAVETQVLGELEPRPLMELHHTAKVIRMDGVRAERIKFGGSDGHGHTPRVLSYGMPTQILTLYY